MHDRFVLTFFVCIGVDNNVIGSSGALLQKLISTFIYQF